MYSAFPPAVEQHLSCEERGINFIDPQKGETVKPNAAAALVAIFYFSTIQARLMFSK